ncbi:autotransporter domain-containing protein [Martelella limonii]|uniref:autotransporter domain-containing protein n=1 Tax=Martelella limonii TaxID=1647649 RepID=UPI00158092E9|nr:autotransporter domain-containing protein [Martelella limonii]
MSIAFAAQNFVFSRKPLRLGAIALLSGTALVPFAAHASPAPVCHATVTGAANLILCDAQHVAVSTGTGDSSLTLDGQVTGSAWMNPAYDTTTPTNHLLIVTGNSQVNNTDNDGAVFFSTAAPDHDAVARFDAGVTIESSAGYGAIWFRNQVSGDISVTSAATVTSSSGAAITAVSNGGNVSVTNSGFVTATATDDRNYTGLYAENGSSDLPDSVVTINNSGTVTAWRAAARAINYNGLSSIINTGTLMSSNRQAIVAWAQVGDVFVENDGTASAGLEEAGIAAWAARNATVVNNGTVTAIGTVNSYGIDIESQTAGNVMLTNNGTATSSNFAALYATTESGSITIANAGEASGQQGVLAAATGGTVTLTNTGTLSGAEEGVSLSGGSVTLGNSGKVTSSGSAALSLKATNGSITITNDGGASGQQGILAAATGGTVTLTNSGMLSGVQEGVSLSGGSVTLGNSGKVTSSGSAALSLTATNGSITITNDGEASGQQGILAAATGGTVTFTSTGTLSGVQEGVSLSGGSVMLTNNGTVTSSKAAALSAAATGGNLTIENAGQASGRQGIAALASGGTATLTNTGTLSGAEEGISLSGSSAMITNNGKVTSDNAAALNVAADGGAITIVNAGELSGELGILATTTGGAIAISNTGTIAGVATGITLSGADDTVINYGTISGGETAATMGGGNDLFVYQNGSTVIGTVDGGAGADTLLLGEIDGTFDIGQIGAEATYRNFETLSLTPGTHWTLTGSSALVGTISLSDATLTLSQSAPSDFGVVMTSALLNGNGTIGALTAGTGAIVSPGNSIGRINVAGDISFLSGSTYVVETDGATGNADLIAASGSATIAGGSLMVAMTAPSANWQNVYTILTAEGGVSGVFDTVTANGATTFLAPAVNYQENTVTVSMARNVTAFASFADTPNERATANALDALNPSSAIYGLIVTQDGPGAAMSFDQLSGEIYATAKTALIDDSRFVRAATARQIWANEGADEPSLWMQGYGSWGGFDGNGNAAGYDRDAGGFFMGADGTFSGLRIGVVGGYGQSTVKLDDGRGSLSADTFTLGVYGGGNFDNVLVNFGLNNGWTQLSSQRFVNFTGYADALSADYDANTFQVYGDVGYSFDFEQGALQPFAGLAYVNVDTDGFSENGGAGALSVRGGSADTTYTTLGVRAKADFKVQDATITAIGLIGWRHSLNDETPVSANAFAGGGLFTVSGVPLAQDVGVFEIGLEAAITPTVSLGINYAGQFGSGVSDQGVAANLKISF